jgi:hypothetical protein|tara:strand:+ start:827 stop:1030 length:204 start_codon:yes stop_codon:yes gene_type:complete
MFKTIKWNTGTAAKRFRLKNKKMKLSKIIKELNKENAPPDGWRPEDQVSSSQAGGPAPKESGSKRQG